MLATRDQKPHLLDCLAALNMALQQRKPDEVIHYREETHVEVVVLTLFGAIYVFFDDPAIEGSTPVILDARGV